MQALRRVGIPVIRWPGGCYADDYDWRDGIGEPGKRPIRVNRWWGGMESNRVGTHEFMDLVQQLDSEAYMSGNVGSMPPRSMVQWLDYMTADDNTTLAQERRHNGRDKPWHIKYFGIGNESFGCGGNMRAEHQSDLHNQYATYIKGVNRVASGDGEGTGHLVEVMMSRSAKHFDALSLHYYSIPGSWEKKGAATGFDASAWASTLRSAMDMEGSITMHKRIMDKYDPDKRIALYVDEWGTWYDTLAGSSALFQQNSLRDALVAAVSFNIFHRHTDRVKMANIAQMVNVLQAMVLTDGEKMVLTPTYHAFDLYRPFRGATPLKAELQTPQWGEGRAALPAVDASVARAADGSTVLALVNLDLQRTASVKTNLTGVVRGRVLTAAAMDAHNTIDKPNTLVPAPYSAGSKGAPLTLDLPPKSVVVVTLIAAH